MTKVVAIIANLKYSRLAINQSVLQIQDYTFPTFSCNIHSEFSAKNFNSQIPFSAFWAHSNSSWPRSTFWAVGRSLHQNFVYMPGLLPAFHTCLSYICCITTHSNPIFSHIHFIEQPWLQLHLREQFRMPMLPVVDNNFNI